MNAEPSASATLLAASGPSRSAGLLRGTSSRTTWLIISLLALIVVVLLSILIGSKGLSPATVWQALFEDDGSYDAVIVRTLRLPRALAGVMVGTALAVAGTLMQAITRNPLADPGILGINAGASIAVVIAIAFLGISDIGGYVWFGFAGAGLAIVAVYLLGSIGQGGATPVRLALAGVAISSALLAFTRAIILTDTDAFDKFRFWDVGSLVGRDFGILLPLLPFFAVGLALSLLMAGPLNAIALGDETSKALGVNIGLVRLGAVVALTLLCGSATAAAGPVGFIGLTIPHVVRSLVGPDLKWVLPFSAVFGAILLLVADVIGRVVAPPGELQVGIVTALIGAPVFIALVRRRKMPQL
ncbi:iron chelate uptake ABC transporter family permease subunit [Saxibacter everestensis]|uniref:Iron chelate uptake ABC transporter family permease subunit n=1 Tax=Saxibacter everestensis TaxID=2909229 RepID=A0ABY8QQS9_9MICO|nr:iron chelate uptake ABC transporter family permease subunit [Brevibacteriaceae bacterium ZFBP1038]